jgi:hypothetical protein
MNMRNLIILTVVLILAFVAGIGAGVAQASWQPTGGWMPYFEESAITTWSAGTGDLPPCGAPTFVWTDWIDAEHGFDVVADANLVTCVIRIDTTNPESAADLCTTVVHEIGHLYGQQHTKRGVMSEYGQADWWKVPACARVLRLRWWTDRNGASWDGYRLRAGARPYLG